MVMMVNDGDADENDGDGDGDGGDGGGDGGDGGGDGGDDDSGGGDDDDIYGNGDVGGDDGGGRDDDDGHGGDGGEGDFGDDDDVDTQHSDQIWHLGLGQPALKLGPDQFWQVENESPRESASPCRRCRRLESNYESVQLLERSGLSQLLRISSHVSSFQTAAALSPFPKIPPQAHNFGFLGLWQTFQSWPWLWKVCAWCVGRYLEKFGIRTVHTARS